MLEPGTPQAVPRLPNPIGNEGLPTSPVEARQLAESVSRALKRAARTARTPASIISGSAGPRARKGDRAFRLGVIASFFVVLLGAVVVESVYWGLIASDQYSTALKFAIREGRSSPLDALGGLLGLGASPTAQDTQIVSEYIKSRGMVQALDKSLDLRRIYSHPSADYFSRFDPADPVEDLEKYWGKRVDVKVDIVSGIVSVVVRAFTPEDSLAIGQEVLARSEALVNDLSTRSRRDALTDARAELDRAGVRLRAATAAIRDARNAEGVLDAKVAAESLDTIVAALRLQKAQLEQDLATQATGRDFSPTARVTEARIAATAAQIDNYNRQIASVRTGGAGSMADRLGVLSSFQTELDLAQQQYAAASAIFESARVELETQKIYLATALRPTLAQGSTYPRRWWQWSIIVFPVAIAWAVAVALAFLVRDNMAK